MSPISEEDLDRLADFTAGLLDPAATAEVSRLIATRPEWADAHAALVAAQPVLDEAFAALPAAPLPAEVAARLDRALAEFAAAGGAAPAVDHRPSGTVVPLTRRRRWARPVLATAAAAVVAAGCLGGVAALRDAGSGSADSASSAAHTGVASGSRDRASPPEQSSPPVAAVPTAASGTDYTPGTLASAALDTGSSPPAIPGGTAAPDTGTVQGHAQPRGVPADLARLTDPTALTSCLAAISDAEGGRALSVDYARYEGQPALIVVLTGAASGAVAAGTGCGLPGHGADLLGSAR